MMEDLTEKSATGCHLQPILTIGDLIANIRTSITLASGGLYHSVSNKSDFGQILLKIFQKKI
ncbi:hypothetical protein DYD21_10420 [Rhodohalobacter sp. SW132]|nr:hypothetical protein DYD21_10420 [Rhodohalobacter sp. SW132]